MITKIADLHLSEETSKAIDLAMDILGVVFLPLLIKYLVQLLFGILSTILFGLRGFRNRCCTKLNQKCQDEVAAENQVPRISVIVPAYNEEVGIVKTLQSVKNTNYPNLQLIVVNDGSTDHTHEKIAKWMGNEDIENVGTSPMKAKKMSIEYLKLENGGKAAAMNTAVTKYVDGEFVMTVDADSVMHPRALQEMVACFMEDPHVGAVAGNVIVANRSKLIGMIQQLEYLSGFFYKRADSLFNSIYIIGGAAAAYRKTVLDQVGSFDDSIITEDIELSTRILKHNWKTRYAHNAYVFTEGPSEWMGLANQRLRWKFGRLKTFWKHKSLFLSFQHNLYLSMFLLPLALYAECLLFFDWLTFPLCIFYIFFINMKYYVWVISFMAGLTLYQIVVDRKRRFHSNLILMAPFTWVAAVFVEMVEFTALYRSVWRLVLGQGLRWQKWKRVGLSDDDLEMAEDEDGAVAEDESDSDAVDIDI